MRKQSSEGPALNPVSGSLPQPLHLLSRPPCSDLSGLPGVWAAVRYLVSLSEAEASLIRTHSKWILLADPESGLEAFLQMQPPLNPSMVLSILHEHSPHYAGMYLEVALEIGVALPQDYHSELLLIYLQDILEQDQQAPSEAGLPTSHSTAEPVPQQPPPTDDSSHADAAAPTGPPSAHTAPAPDRKQSGSSQRNTPTRHQHRRDTAVTDPVALFPDSPPHEHRQQRSMAAAHLLTPQRRQHGAANDASHQPHQAWRSLGRDAPHRELCSDPGRQQRTPHDSPNPTHSGERAQSPPPPRGAPRPSPMPRQLSTRQLPTPPRPTLATHAPTAVPAAAAHTPSLRLPPPRHTPPPRRQAPSPPLTPMPTPSTTPPQASSPLPHAQHTSGRKDASESASQPATGGLSSPYSDAAISHELQRSASPPHGPTLYQRLRDLVYTSPYIDPNYVLSKLPQGRLLEIQALMLERLGRHREALTLYVRELQDMQLAEEYCDRVYSASVATASAAALHTPPPPPANLLRPTRDAVAASSGAGGSDGGANGHGARGGSHVGSHGAGRQHTEKQHGGADLRWARGGVGERPGDVYLELLQAVLGHEEIGSGPALLIDDHAGWRRLCTLLNRKRERLDAPAALGMLPDGASLRDVVPFLEGVLCHVVQQRRKLLVLRHLRRAENLRVREELVRCKQQRVLITAERACCICHRRIGSAVAVANPNKTLTHYLCYKRLHPELAGALPTSSGPVLHGSTVVPTGSISMARPFIRTLLDMYNIFQSIDPKDLLASNPLSSVSRPETLFLTKESPSSSSTTAPPSQPQPWRLAKLVQQSHEITKGLLQQQRQHRAELSPLTSQIQHNKPQFAI
ncbi:MAG: hypothetical protein WDW38_005909 [Sanguina aurantia]